MSHYYPSNYAPYLVTDPANEPKRTPLRARLVAWLGLESRRLPSGPPGHLIEIGCAAGAFMEKARRCGWHVAGIEFSEAAAREARLRGFPVQCASVETAEPPPGRVDVIAAWMVVEHLHEPVVALREMRKWIKPSGYFIASVPDASAIERRVFGKRWYALQLPTHLFHYTPSTLRRVLAEAGWVVERITWERNCNNLLRSLEYLAGDKGWPRVLQALRAFRCSPKASRPRTLLALLLGLTRQSGRMEVWARPVVGMQDGNG